MEEPSALESDTPEPQRLVFSVLGMIDARAAADIEAAVKSADPAAAFTASLPAALIEVRTRNDAATIRAAIEAAGFPAEPITRRLPPPSPFTGRTVAHLVRRALLWGLAWTVLGPLVSLVPLAGLHIANPVCGTPGDSGGCEMGLAMVFMAMIPVGFVLGFLVTLGCGILQLRRAPQPA